MEKHQIVEVSEASNHAGKKAPADISEIAERLGYKKHFIRMKTSEKGVVAKLQRQIGYQEDWKRCYDEIPSDSIVLIQNPFHNPHLTRDSILKKMKIKKNIRFISIIHDVEELRSVVYNSYYKNEFDVMTSLSDVFIVHNTIMKEFFVKKGVPKEKIVILEIFDYLHSFKKKFPEFSKTISIAGNLDVNKCRYIGELTKLKELNFKLYGVNFNEEMNKFDHIKYCGSFPVDQIPAQLNTGYGLVWDGDSIETCTGATGKYLKYNNPHKLSLYLSSGLPVIIWSEAAEADFVRNNDVGICIDSLENLSDIIKTIDENRYLEMAENVKLIAEQLIDGRFSTKALEISEHIIQG